MKTRILFLTAGFGEGHNAAARALAAATDERLGTGAACVADVFALARPRLNQLVRRSYLSLINHAPGVWRRTYAWLDRSAGSTRMFAGLRREIHFLQQLIARKQPDVLCSTYPLYAFMLQVIARRAGLSMPHYNVVTDSISINSLWWRADCAGWFLPNQDSAGVLAQAGVNPARLHTCGFPVALSFANNAGRIAPPPLEPGARPRVLFIVNSGTRGAVATALALLQQEDWDITCTVGRDELLRNNLVRAARRRRNPAVVLGWTDEIPRLLMSHHVVISKAGGATTQEAIAARCPMVVNQIVPGQEEGNYELLRRHGIGFLGTTPDVIIAGLRQAFGDDGRVWRQWRVALERLARPNAARDIVATMLRRAASGADGPRGANSPESRDPRAVVSRCGFP